MPEIPSQPQPEAKTETPSEPIVEPIAEAISQPNFENVIVTSPAPVAPAAPAPPPEPSKPPIIELKSVSKWFPDQRSGQRLVTIENLDLTIPDQENGEFLALLGPSGCGKSTVIQLISGLLIPDGGEVRIKGDVVKGDNALSVTVQQAYTCFPWLTVGRNVEFGLDILGKPPAQRREIALNYLEKVGLADRFDAYPRQLSGGMQQRVAIARALAMQPPIVLMDEPFGALDAQTRAEMQQMLLDLWAQEKNLIFFITHDITEALLLADRIVVLAPRPTSIIYDLKVPFARPRLPELVYEREFIELSQKLLELLKKSPASGQVRVSV